MNEHLKLEQQLTTALKSIARRRDLKDYVEQNPQVNRILRQAALRYIAGDSLQEGLETGEKIWRRGYFLSIEYIGENTSDAIQCEQAVAEMIALIQGLKQSGVPGRVSFDLSHIGLMISPSLAYSNLMEMAKQAEGTNIELFISMEESGKTEGILSVYKRAAAECSSIGITLQAHLTRTPEDLAALTSPGRIRIVKGAYQESAYLSIVRSPELNERYLELVEAAIRQGHQVSIATHDDVIINAVLERGWLTNSQAELEMLYGIRPDLANRIRSEGNPIRIYVPYGHEWYLYLCHRIAEYPPNLYQAVIDIVSGKGVENNY
ncbi:proline dehydrogenase family protein [Paenibacillus chondroitinus]|uniref:proline dehydrogenase n=1 Tax=Paenibacillus chondroitinus TaxID=59842 RepID=A0ABU6DD79_9BACL|nr:MULTISPECIES: proline dehydrogenase family protein [Paenibacillus]MCY9656423.1 proline dehydrogenase family protein [Paenibacillus anseongense]MEB4795247.1 proline dehydrogenase family protein [Paenibacillus chondroitinus]